MSEQNTTNRWLQGAALFMAGGLAASALTGIALADNDDQDESGPLLGEESQDPRGPGMGMRSGGPGMGMGFHRGPGGPGGAGGLGGMLHGEGVIKNKEGDIVNLAVQTGEVSSASDTAVTVRSEDGYEATYSINEDTTVTRDRESVSGADLQRGDWVKVAAELGGNDRTAVHVHALSADQKAELEERREEMKQRFEERRERMEDGFKQRYGLPEDAEPVDPNKA